MIILLFFKDDSSSIYCLSLTQATILGLLFGYFFNNDATANSDLILFFSSKALIITVFALSIEQLFKSTLLVMSQCLIMIVIFLP